MELLVPVLIIGAIGLVFGLGLSLAHEKMAVKSEPKVEALLEALPGSNCGACGYSGCEGYAKALAEGARVLTLCAPGGEKSAAQIGEILGVAVGPVKPKSAVVRCAGSLQNQKQAFTYDGIPSCEMASRLAGGPSGCKYGCIGLGDCARACEYGAIRISNGLAAVDPRLCKACRKCVPACPKGLIVLADVSQPRAMVACMNREKGALTRTVCSSGCIACRKCVKSCEFDAISILENTAVIDPAKCTNCGKCVENCPVSCIITSSCLVKQ
ncbi:MAG: RnfABCDGE type electron transport complex subunit B [Clostridiales bacterium]|nr:RnfABCDGE type electron transport complex subunit B [Clostridiales bacterium]